MFGSRLTNCVLIFCAAIGMAGCAGSVLGNGPNGGGLSLEVTPSSIQFGNVPVGAEYSQSIQVTATGKSDVTVERIDVGGQFFTFAGPKLPRTLSPGQSLSFTAEFRPGSLGNKSGTISVVSNTPDSQLQIPMTGAGVKLAVSLNWDASSSPSVVGYNIYRSSVVDGKFTKMNAAIDASASYSDSAVSSGKTYYYVVTAVDSKNEESAFSAPASVSVP